MPVQQGGGPPQQARQAGGQQKVLHKDKAGIDHEKEHMKEHQQHIDTSNMSEQELQFHYFKMHDSDGEFNYQHNQMFEMDRQLLVILDLKTNFHFRQQQIGWTGVGEIFNTLAR